MGEMTSVRKVKTHDAVMGVEDGRVGVEVGGRSREGFTMLALIMMRIA